MVDEHAGEVVADGLVHERGRDRGVDAAGEAADDELVADLRADARDLLVDHVGRRPVGVDARDVVQEVLEHRLAVLGVQHLGVELHAGEAAVAVLEGGDGGAVGRRATTRKPSGAACTASPCDIQTVCVVRGAGEQRGAAGR